MEIDPRKTKGEEEEEVMMKLLQEWKRLDERFIREDQKQMYKEAFQRYKEKKGITEDRRVGKMEMKETQKSMNDQYWQGR